MNSDAEDILERLNDDVELGAELEVEFADSDETLSDLSVDPSEPSTSKRRKFGSQPK